MSHSPPIDDRRLAVIGFGEAGRILGAGLAASGHFDVSAFDILVRDPAGRGPMLAAAAERNVTMAESHRAAIAGARIVVSAVTASASTDVAREAAASLAPGQIFADINSVSPGTKRINARLIEDAGGHYVDVAVMAPVPPYGLRVPILLGGGRAAELAKRLAPAGMKLEVVADSVGTASAIKMCRSVMIKGIEALVVESMLGARRYGVEDRVLASLEETFPQMKWDERADYLVSRVVVHGRRRAAEMREVAATLREVGLLPFMASATAECQDRIADLAEADARSRAMEKDFSWRDFADGIAAIGERDRASVAAR
jgi:3-hydroxyisobutyrate dehydrogenase-like beta-hydroxyacid dehydrogenase